LQTIFQDEGDGRERTNAGNRHQPLKFIALAFQIAAGDEGAEPRKLKGLVELKLDRTLVLLIKSVSGQR
jgi:hypothetical protein